MRENQNRSVFDRFAEAAANFVSHAPFFAFCVLLIVVWLPTLPLVGTFNTWQLLINTPTTILTFLLVAVLQNSQRRAEESLQQKLNAVADGLADLMEYFVDHSGDRGDELRRDIADLKAAVGLEGRI